MNIDTAFAERVVEKARSRGATNAEVIVYEATDTVLNRSVALKIVLPSLPDRENYQARFAQEAAVLAKIRSRHIVGIHEYGERQLDNALDFARIWPPLGFRADCGQPGSDDEIAGEDVAVGELADNV